jgi:hypothetical protein
MACGRALGAITPELVQLALEQTFDLWNLGISSSITDPHRGQRWEVRNSLELRTTRCRERNSISLSADEAEAEAEAELAERPGFDEPALPTTTTG